MSKKYYIAFSLLLSIILSGCDKEDEECHDVPVVGYCFYDENGPRWRVGHEHTPEGSVQEKDIPFGLGAAFGFVTCADCFSEGGPVSEKIRKECEEFNNVVCE